MSKKAKKSAAKKPPVLKTKTGKKGATERPLLGPATGRVTKAEIEELLTKANGVSAPAVTHLERQDIEVCKHGIFQWRQPDQLKSSNHIDVLKRALRSTGEPLQPILVFPAGDRFFTMDGHHRLTAYDVAPWNRPIPVEVFSGSLDAALMEGLRRNVADKLSMTYAEKSEAAWRLMKEREVRGLSKADIVKDTTIADGTFNNMRLKWNALKAEATATGDQRLLEMDWAHAKRWGGAPVEYDEEWREKTVETLKNRIIQSGLASAFTTKLDLMMEALSRIDPNLPANLASEAGPEICKWVLEQHNDAMELEIEMAKRRADIPAELLEDF
jgi:hypothetical protein